MNLQYEYFITSNGFGFQKILDDFENTSTINILTFNISTKQNKLLSILKKIENNNYNNKYSTKMGKLLQ